MIIETHYQMQHSSPASVFGALYAKEEQEVSAVSHGPPRRHQLRNYSHLSDEDCCDLTTQNDFSASDKTNCSAPSLYGLSFAMGYDVEVAEARSFCYE